MLEENEQLYGEAFLLRARRREWRFRNSPFLRRRSESRRLRFLAGLPLRGELHDEGDEEGRDETGDEAQGVHGVGALREGHRGRGYRHGVHEGRGEEKGEGR